MFEVGEILLAIEREANFHDGLATVPAYLLEQLHNVVFTGDQRHEYTEAA